MLIFALLCPLFIWPLHRQVARHGFSLNTYVLWALALYAIGAGLAYALIRFAPGGQSFWMQLPFIGVFVNHFAFVIVGNLSTPEEVQARELRQRADEGHRRERLAALEAEAESWPCLKTYLSGGQQYEYLTDRRLLDEHALRYFVRSSLITNLHIHPDDHGRAAALLGVQA